MIQLKNQPTPMRKGESTRKMLVDLALQLATEHGLENLTLSEISHEAHMSKSGVFSHFGSREDLQVAVVHAYFEYFEKEVFQPALTASRGLPRVKALFSNWMLRVAEELNSGCLFIKGAMAFDAREDVVREALSSSIAMWMDAFSKAITQAKECGHLRADTDEKQVVFEIHGLILALHFEARFLRTPDPMIRARTGFENIFHAYLVS